MQTIWFHQLITCQSTIALNSLTNISIMIITLHTPCSLCICALNHYRIRTVNRKWPCPNHCICPSASGQFGPIHVSASKLHSYHSSLTRGSHDNVVTVIASIVSQNINKASFGFYISCSLSRPVTRSPSSPTELYQFYQVNTRQPPCSQVTLISYRTILVLPGKHKIAAL